MITIYMQVFKKDAPSDIEQAYLTNNTDFKEGKMLAKRYCAGCHSYPEPGLLPKRIWASQTLPHMGPQMGIFEHNGTRYPVERTPNLPENYYPSEPLLSNERWQKILDYYEKAAPERFSPAERDREIINDTLFFKAHTPEYRAKTPPMVTAVKLDPGNQFIYLSDANEEKFLIFNTELELANSFTISSTLSDIRITNDRYKPGKRDLILTYIGELKPSDAPRGVVQKFWYDPETGDGAAGSVVYGHIARPVESQLTDLDQDGNNDVLISEFGHRTGGLFWLKNTGKGTTPEKRVLVDTPGCIQSYITDYNNNGLPDIIALCTQVDQAIYLFLNQGNGEFVIKTLLQFQITAGSSSFEMHDFNDDGHLDILYTSGDNADYSIVYKPYHGVYIYLNDGNDNFTKAWFYPVNGAYNAIARDFNLDGMLDIAAISFFADYVKRPQEGFVFFLQSHPPAGGKNKGDLTFTPYHHPAASGGRWIAMDVADWEGDGDDDIILANFSLGPTRVVPRIQDKWARGPHFLLLENKSVRVAKK